MSNSGVTGSSERFAQRRGRSDTVDMLCDRTHVFYGKNTAVATIGRPWSEVEGRRK